MNPPAITRVNGRAPDALRPVSIETGVMKFAEGSALIELGETRVLVSATVENRVPPFLVGTGKGWLTAEYSMLPRATQTRSTREVAQGRPSGRTAEIQRLIGRSLRAVADLSAMLDLTVVVDCDVLQADGGTRTAAVTGAYVATVLALGPLFLAGDLARWPITDAVAAVSVGIVRDTPLLDLEYLEDQEAEVDMNVVGTPSGALVEVQGTGERRSFERRELESLLDLAFKGLGELSALQRHALEPTLKDVREVQSKGKRHRARPKNESELWGEPR